MQNLEKLEYNKILEKLSSYCSTESAKQIALELKPEINSELVQKLLDETSEAFRLIQRCSNPPDINFEKDEYSLKVLETYGILSLKAILNITKILKISQNYKNYFNQEFIEAHDFPILQPQITNLYTNSGIIEKIEESIIDENTLDDNASKNLASIRKKQRNVEADIKQKLTNMVHSSTYSKYIQENVVTIRNGRYVIPVKDEYRSQIKGFVHDVSSSGSTVFIEPIAVFELNNELTNLKMEENLEIEKIMQELSKLFYPYGEEIKLDIEILTNLDFIFAKAKYAKSINANQPQINTNKQIILEEARHPLIDIKQVVPTSLTLGKDYETLLITGPNTGGKTVTLKTVGLLVSMACSGLHIPAKSSSSIYVFNQIFADIGDEQSIQDSLSTFSAHMKNMVHIIEKADENTLVLVDELGSGTDPIEGQALAISMLEYLQENRSLVIATTHYQELKKYAMTAKGFENASVEFDIETLTPTYRLLIGVPGKSNAFAISQKLGLKEDIIKNAKNRIEKNDVDFEELMKQIYDDKSKIEAEKEQISKELIQVQNLRKSLEKDNTKLLQKQQEQIENAKIEARNILLEAKEEANEMIKRLQKLEEDAKSEANISKQANEIRINLNKKIKETSNTKTQEQNKENTIVNKESIKINTHVFVKTLNQKGTVVSNVSKDNQVQVQIGSMKMSIPIQNLEILKNIKEKSVQISSKVSKSRNVNTEINVIGQTVEEACMLVDKFLDDSSLVKLQNVRIVHGKGTGKLRAGIHKLLDRNPHVKSYRMGTFGEGEMGVTVVELK